MATHRLKRPTTLNPRPLPGHVPQPFQRRHQALDGLAGACAVRSSSVRGLALVAKCPSLYQGSTKR